MVSDHPARNTNAGCGPDLFRRRRVGSSFVQSKRIRHNASISEPGQMYKNGSDWDPIMMIRATSRARKNHPIRIRIVCGKTDPANRIRPDSGCPLAVMAIIGRIQNGSIMFTGVTFECSAAGQSNMENRRILGRFHGLCWQNIVTTEQLYSGKSFLRKGLGVTAILTGMLLFLPYKGRIKELRMKVPASIFPLAHLHPSVS